MSFLDQYSRLGREPVWELSALGYFVTHGREEDDSDFQHTTQYR